MKTKNYKPFVLNGKTFSHVHGSSIDGEVGKYKATSKGVYIYVNGELVGFACDQPNFTGLVTAYHFNGKIHYMFGASDILAKLVGFDSVKYSEKAELVSSALKDFWAVPCA